MKIPPARIRAFLAAPDKACVAVLVYGPDAGLVDERVDALARTVVPDPADPFRIARMTGAALAAEFRRLTGVTERVVVAARRELDAERRALDGLRPAERLAQARERAGVLLDRATRTVQDRLAGARIAEQRAEARIRPIVALRLGAAHAALDSGAAALAVLGPQATLDRGYAIVRLGTDGRILRRAGDAPAGTALNIRLAEGELGATSTGPGESK